MALSLFLLFSLHQSDIATSQTQDSKTPQENIISLSDTTKVHLDSTKIQLSSELSQLDQDSLKATQLFEVFEQLGINHPLTINIFAVDDNGKSRAKDLISHYKNNHQIIDQYGAQVKLNPYSIQNYVGGRAILESGLKKDAKAGEGKYLAVGEFQYIPETWKNEYGSVMKNYPGIGIKNDRTDLKSSAIVANHHFNKSLKVCNSRPGFALRGHHAGIERMIGCKHPDPKKPGKTIHKHLGYINMFYDITGEQAKSVPDWYNSVLPWSLIDEFMSLNDNSAIYNGQVMAQQEVYNALRKDIVLVEKQIQLFEIMQITKTRGAAIDDINYPHNYHNLNNITICDRDPTLDQLLITISNIADQPLQTIDPHIVWKDRYREKIAVNAIVSGKGVKISTPFTNPKLINKDISPTGIKYKRVRYLLEMARIHGLISLATERLPSGELVYHVGLMPHVTMQNIYHFASLKNYNIKTPQSGELVQSK